MTAVPLLQDYLCASAQRLADKVALTHERGRATYGEIERASNALAHHLARAQVARGDRVLVLLDNALEAVVAFWAVLKANAVVIMANPTVKAEKLGYLLRDSGASAMITHASFSAEIGPAVAAAPCVTTLVAAGDAAALAQRVAVPVIPWQEAQRAQDTGQPPRRQCIDIDLAAIVYTSGSTGDAKGVMLTHRNMLAATESISSYLEIGEDEVILNVLPLAFDYGLYQMIMAFRAGARLVLERSFAFPMQVVGRVQQEGVTGFPGVPTLFAMLGELKSLSPEAFATVRYVTNTAAALPVKHIALLRRLFARAKIYSMYGLTECKRCTYLPPADLERKPASVGLAIPNTELWLVGENGERLPPGRIGQLVIRGATVMRGYWGKPEETAEKLRPGPLPGELVLYTGDYCRLDEEGYLYFVGRMDDIIKSRGEKVAPKEVEMALTSIEGVREAAVVGVDDELLGQAVKAFVVLEQGAVLTDRELQAECQSRLESFMVPKQIVVVAELPKTPNGKIAKASLIEPAPLDASSGERPPKAA